MNENFRLLEYKRKKYIEKKRASASKSPPKDRSAERVSVVPGAQRNFLTSLYGVEPAGKQQQQSLLFN